MSKNWFRIIWSVPLLLVFLVIVVLSDLENSCMPSGSVKSGGCSSYHFLEKVTRWVEVPFSLDHDPQASSTLSVDFNTVTGTEPDSWGTNVWWSDQDATLWTNRWRELGLRVVRVPLPHGAVEPVNDNEDPTTVNMSAFMLETPVQLSGYGTRTITLRDWFVALRDTPSLEVMVYVPYLAPWLSPNPAFEGYVFPAAPFPPNDLAEYREFVEVVIRYLVEELGLPPERLLIEAMNEPDLNCGQDPAVPCFWQNWDLDDIADVVQVTCEVAEAVNPSIRVIGLSECCGTDVVRAYLDTYSESDCLDGLSYHYYAPSGFDLSQALNRAATLVPYGRPLYLDEYGSFSYLSDGPSGGLWHSWALSELWDASIAPIQYPISEVPQLQDPYRSMGLFYDWTANWQRKPAYWIYVNFYQLIAVGETLSLTGSSPSTVRALATRTLDEKPGVAFWVTSLDDAPLDEQRFIVHHFPASTAELSAYDNLVGPSPLFTTTVAGSPLVFTQTVPAYSSRTFVVRAAEVMSELVGLSLTPESATCIGGESVAYTLTAHYATTDVDVTTSGTYTISPGAGGYWEENVYTSELPGNWTVTGSYAGESTQATAGLQVLNELLGLSLAPTSTIRRAGESVTYTLTAHYATTDVDVTPTGTYTISPGAGGYWEENVYTSELPGNWTVTGTYAEESTQATLRVLSVPYNLYLPIVLRA